MRYMMMICSDEADDAAMTPEDLGPMLQEYMKLTEDMDAAKVREASDRLRPVADATTVRVRAGKVQVTDGPFAETKEQIGGFYLIDVANLDEAIAWAQRIPSAKMGSVEIRPIWEPEDYGA